MKRRRRPILQKIVIIADDLTGAADTGIQFTKQGLISLVIIDKCYTKDIPTNIQVIAFNTNTRDMVAKAAYKRVNTVAKAIKNRGIKCIYKKIDSMLRGNVGAEIDGLMDVAKVRTAVLVPSLPAQGRITVGGYHLVNQIPLQNTEAGRNSKNPIKTSYLPTLVQSQTERKVGHISLSVVMQGMQALERAITNCQKDGSEIIIIDAISQDDLSAIANTLVLMGMIKIVIGSAGIASELAVSLKPCNGRIEGRNIIKKKGSVVVICGTRSEITMQQIRKAERNLNVYIAEIDLNKISKKQSDIDRELSILLDKINKSISDGKDIIVKLKNSKVSVPKKDYSELNLKMSTTTKLIKKTFGQIACRIVRDNEIAGLVLTGGDTAMSICRKLNSWGILLKEEISPGIPVGELIGGKFEGLNVITKAGSFGKEDTLVRLIEYLAPDNGVRRSFD